MYKRQPGVGEHTAVLLRMLPALLGRYQGSRARLAAVINWPEDAYAWLEPYYFGARNEMVYVLCLDGKRQVLGVRRVAEGSIEMAQVNTRRIAEEALGLRAARIYVAHNHVSNLALPSQAAVSYTHLDVYKRQLEYEHTASRQDDDHTADEQGHLQGGKIYTRRLCTAARLLSLIHIFRPRRPFQRAPRRPWLPPLSVWGRGTPPRWP